MEKLSEKSMMEATTKVKRQSSLIHHKIRKAAFVPLESERLERFKYRLVYNIVQRLKSGLINLKRFVNSIIQQPRLWTSKVDWIKLRNDLVVVTIETMLEGLTANFATHYLFGLPITPATILAHGIMIRQGLSIYSRIKKDGANPTIPKKHE